MNPAQLHTQCCAPQPCILTSLFFSHLHLPSLVLTYLTRASLEVRSSKGLRLVIPKIVGVAQSSRHKKRRRWRTDQRLLRSPGGGCRRLHTQVYITRREGAGLPLRVRSMAMQSIKGSENESKATQLYPPRKSLERIAMTMKKTPSTAR